MQGKGTAVLEPSVAKVDKQPNLHGSSSAAGTVGASVDNSIITVTGAGVADVNQKVVTAKICRRCGVKGHLMSECTAIVFCEICKSTDHALSRCLIPKQPKPIAQLIGQAADALAGVYIPHAPIQSTKRDSRLVLVSTFGKKKLSEEEVVAYLPVLVSDTFNWEVQRLSDSKFKVLFPTKGDLTKMTKFNAEMRECVSLKFQKFKEDEEYFGHALPMVWMRVLNLPFILREYVILWALETVFGVTQDVDMVTRANSFGRFAVAVLEPEAIPTKHDVIIGNRKFQLIFQVEPYLPNVGLRNIWNNQNGGNEDHGNGTPKDTEMKETKNNDGTSISGATGGNAASMSSSGKEDLAPDAQMDLDLSEDDLLGEENDLGEAAHDFVGVKKGHSVEVRTAAALSSSAPARILQRTSQLAELGGKAALQGSTPQLSVGTSTQPGCDQKLGKVPLSSTAGATDGPHGNSKQSFIASIDDQMEASVGQFVGATEGEVADGTQHLGALLDAMIEAGVQADGVPEKE
jgi:hypothetical protein